MDVRVLRYFLAVAREENFSRAAEFLNVTQPTLSRQLMELEDELGARLFVRGKRGTSLTEEGMFLRRRAEEIVELVSKTEAEFSAPSNMVSGEIRIGGGETDGIRVIAKAAGSFRKDYPAVRFSVFSGDGESVTEALDKGLLDFGVLVELAPDKYESARLPVSDVWGVLTPADGPLAAKKSVKPEDLSCLPLIFSRQSLRGGEFSEWFGSAYGGLNVAAVYNLVYNASIMVEEGMGHALCLDKLVNVTGKSPLCFRPLEPGLEANLYLVWKKYQIFSRASKLFLERILKKLKA